MLHYPKYPHNDRLGFVFVLHRTQGRLVPLGRSCPPPKIKSTISLQLIRRWCGLSGLKAMGRWLGPKTMLPSSAGGSSGHGGTPTAPAMASSDDGSRQAIRRWWPRRPYRCHT